MPTLDEVLLQGAEEAGLKMAPEELAAYQSYGELLVEWNQKVNLTAILDPEGVAIKHFLDSLMITQYGDFNGTLKVLDVGTGAGFPGIPLKIHLPCLEVTLLDSLRKRVSFLDEVIAQVKLQGIRAVHGRAEEFGHQAAYRETYDRVVARAVAKIAVLAEYCLPLVKKGGLFLALKGSNIEGEVEEGLYAVQELGGRVKAVVNYTLPISKDGRSLVIIEKVKETPKKYPRKAGLPEKKPLTNA